MIKKRGGKGLGIICYVVHKGPFFEHKNAMCERDLCMCAAYHFMIPRSSYTMCLKPCFSPFLFHSFFLSFNFSLVNVTFFSFDSTRRITWVKTTTTTLARIAST